MLDNMPYPSLDEITDQDGMIDFEPAEAARVLAVERLATIDVLGAWF